MLSKKCNRCGEVKELSEFQFRNDSQKHRPYCEVCRSDQKKEHYKKNKNEILNKNKKYRENNVESTAKQSKLYREENKEEINKKNRERYNNDKERILKVQKEWYQENKEEIKKKNKENYDPELNRIRGAEYRRKNKDVISKKKYESKKNRLKIDPEFKLKENISSLFRVNILNGGAIKSKKFYEYTGIEKKDYIMHLKKETLWDDYKNGEKIEVDHIIPVSIYNFNYREEIKNVWNLRNLRLLERKKNIKKSNKIDYNLIEKHELWDLLPESILIEGMELNGKIFTR